MTKGVGITAKQLRLLGLSYPPKNGWLKRIVGTQISEESARLFVKYGKGGLNARNNSK